MVPQINAKRILIVNVNWIGDALFSTPFIHAIRNLYPESFIACMITPRTKEALENNPYIDKLIIFDEDMSHKGLLGKLKFAFELRKLRFDTVFFLHRSATRRFIAFLAGIKRRIGYPGLKGSFFLTDTVEVPPEEMHKADYFLNIAKSVGADTNNLTYEFFISDKERVSVKRLLEENGIRENDRFVVINPGGNWAPKRWPKENFAKLAIELAKRYNVRIIITGSKSDTELAEDIKGLAGGGCTTFCGKTNLKELAALMERSKLVIANDSGPMHIASSCGVNTIALFGPTKSALTGPYSKGNSFVLNRDIGCAVPCYNFDCKDFRCMKAISPTDVLRKIEEMHLL